MAVPKFTAFIRPVLEFVKENPGAHNSEIAEAMAVHFGLSEEERDDSVKSGRPRYVDRVLWSLTYLRQAKLIQSVRGKSEITARGSDFLPLAPQIIDHSVLGQFSEFSEFASRSNAESPSQMTLEKTIEEETPFEKISTAALEINTALKEQLLGSLKAVSPARFEQVIVELMLALGYGGNFENAGKAVGQSGDGGIDGIIRLDRLGLENVYLQAKRYGDTVVGVGEVNSFIGALTTRGANKGVMITTSRFSESARKAVENARHLQLSLIDGSQLCGLMVDANLGVSVESTFVVKRLDTGFFEM